MSLFARSPNFDPRVPLADAEVSYWPQFLEPQRAALLLQELRHQVTWETKTIQIFGRQVLSPRLTAWHGDDHARYSYSGLDLVPMAWTPALRAVRDAVQGQLEQEFHGVLCNLYRDGSDSMGWHADDERELGPQPVIASVSLGATRRFSMRHRTRKGLTHRIDLTSGSLLVMSGPTQRHWQHAVHKSKRPLGARVNLTFRQLPR